MKEVARINLHTATEVTPAIRELIHDMFQYHSWDSDKVERGFEVRAALENAVLVIIKNVPPCPDRSVSIRKIREARMDANMAITHEGKY